MGKLGGKSSAKLLVNSSLRLFDYSLKAQIGRFVIFGVLVKVFYELMGNLILIGYLQ